MRKLIYVVTILFFFLQGISVIGQVNSDKKKYESRSMDETPSLNEQVAPSSQLDLMNFYFSKRKQSVNKFSKEIDEAEQKELDNIVTSLKDQNPNSYEYHYVNYVNSNFDVNAFSDLEKANEISPNNVELYDEFIAHYEITNNSKKKNSYCQQLYESNIIHDGVLEYNFNVLNSLEPNAILFTNGADDTYPAWIQQEVKNIRKDVTILNLDLLSNSQYREDIYKQSGLINPNISISDLVYQTSINNPNKPIYIGLTVNPKVLEKMKDKLYITGLAFKYSPASYDNVIKLVSNWEHLFNQSELNKPVSNTTLKQINLNYILPLIIIRDHYINSNERTKKNNVEDIILKLAKEAHKEEQIKKYLNN